MKVKIKELIEQLVFAQHLNNCYNEQLVSTQNN